MKSLRIQAAVGGLAVAAGLLLAACGSPAPGALMGQTRTDASPSQAPAEALVSREPGGDKGITVTVARTGDQVLEQPGIGPDLTAMKGRVLPFAITLDTHAGDISKLDLNGKVFMKDGAGMELPAMVKQLSTATHHTTYAAAFPKLDSRGKALDDPAQEGLQIVIRGVGQAAERILVWEP